MSEVVLLQMKASNAKRSLLALSILLLASMAPASEDGTKTARCGAVDQVYLYATPDPDHWLPAVLLLHGSGDRAAHMIQAWSQIAHQQKIVLLAPELPRDPKFEESAPQIFRCMVEDAKNFLRIDPQRVYLFGNSMGGYLAYDGAMFESDYFAAVAVHAMRIADDYQWIVNRAHRKTPIAIYIGDHDQFFSLESVRKTRDLLQNAGFPLHYVELGQHDHNYYALSEKINADSWDFLRQNQLPTGAPSR